MDKTTSADSRESLNRNPRAFYNTFEGEITKMHKFRSKTTLKSKEGTAECDRGGLRTSQVCAKCIVRGWGAGRRPQHIPRWDPGMAAAGMAFAPWEKQTTALGKTRQDE